MIKREILQNILIFMDRVTVTGKEVPAFVQTVQAIHTEMAALGAPTSSGNPADVPVQ